jgi:hypothetical protein
MCWRICSNMRLASIRNRFLRFCRIGLMLLVVCRFRFSRIRHHMQTIHEKIVDHILHNCGFAKLCLFNRLLPQTLAPKDAGTMLLATDEDTRWIMVDQSQLCGQCCAAWNCVCLHHVLLHLSKPDSALGLIQAQWDCSDDGTALLFFNRQFRNWNVSDDSYLTCRRFLSKLVWDENRFRSPRFRDRPLWVRKYCISSLAREDAYSQSLVVVLGVGLLNSLKTIIPVSIIDHSGQIWWIIVQ